MNLSAWTSRTETPGMLAVFVENRSRRVEGVLVKSKSQAAARRALDFGISKISVRWGETFGNAGARINVSPLT